MLNLFRLSRSSTLGRVLYIICTVIVLSYVFFDVLDLDGSDFPKPLNPAKTYVVTPNVLNVTERFHVTKWVKLWTDLSPCSTSWGDDWKVLRRIDGPRPSTLNSARARGYRRALPRSSVSDSSVPA